MAFFFERDVCKVLSDLMSCYKTRNFSMLPGLIAELEIMKDRGENFKDMQSAYERLMNLLPKLKKETDDARKERDDMQEEVAKLKETKSLVEHDLKVVEEKYEKKRPIP